MLIGLLAVQIALGARGKQADSAGALHELASQRGGIVILWLPAAAFARLALWRLAEAAYGNRDAEATHQANGCSRLDSGIFYGFTCVGVIDFIRGTESSSSSNTRAAALMPGVMAHPGGQWLLIMSGTGPLAAGRRRAGTSALRDLLLLRGTVAHNAARVAATVSARSGTFILAFASRS